MTLSVKSFLIAGLLLVSFPFAEGLPEGAREKILERARVFIDAVSSRNEGRLKTCLSSGIEVKYLSKPDLKKKIDAMISSEITALEYLQTVSGYNMHKFMADFDGRKWEIPTKPEVPREILDEKIESAKGTQRYYFVKFQMQVHEEVAATAQVKTFSRLVEIDFMAEGDDFKIFGFIL